MKDKKNGNPTSPPPAGEVKAEKKVLTPEQEKALYTAYAHAQAKVDACATAMSKAKEVRDGAIKALIDGCGHGPFVGPDGRRFTAVKAPQGDGYCLRFEKSREVKRLG